MHLPGSVSHHDGKDLRTDSMAVESLVQIADRTLHGPLRRTNRRANAENFWSKVEKSVNALSNEVDSVDTSLIVEIFEVACK